jgi:hypothetical protein
VSFREPTDRTVHARIYDQAGIATEVVRYDVSGKWYWERPGDRALMKIDDAVEMLVDAKADGKHTEWFINAKGGSLFDRRVRDALGRGGQD